MFKHIFISCLSILDFVNTRNFNLMMDIGRDYLQFYLLWLYYVSLIKGEKRINGEQLNRFCFLFGNMVDIDIQKTCKF